MRPTSILVAALLATLPLGAAAPAQDVPFVGIREVGGRERRIYHTGESVRFQVAGLNPTELGYDARSLSSRNQSGGRFAVTDGTAALSLANWRKGLWEVRVFAGAFEHTVRFALVDPPAVWTLAESERHPAGMVGRADAGDIELMRLLGIRSIHVGVPTRTIHASADSPIVFPKELDDFVLKAREAGISVALKYSSFPAWMADEAPREERREPLPTPAPQPTNRAGAQPPTNDQAWAKLVRACTEHYAAMGVRIWILANEPDGGGFFRGGAPAYIRFVRQTAPLIKAAQPDAIVVGPEVYSGDTPFMRQVLEACADHFDVMSFHKPQHPWGAPYGHYQRLKAQYFPDRPMWNTEGEGRTEFLPGYGLSVIRDLGHGVAKYYGYAFNSGVQNMFDRWGRVNECGVEFRAVSDIMTDVEWMGPNPDMGANMELYFFRKKVGGEVFAVGWCELVPETVYFKSEKPAHRIVDRFGNSWQKQTGDGALELSFPYDPVFIFGFDSVPAVAKDRRRLP